MAVSPDERAFVPKDSWVGMIMVVAVVVVAEALVIDRPAFQLSGAADLSEQMSRCVIN